MKTENLLSLVNRIAKLLPEDEQKFIEKESKKEFNPMYESIPLLLACLKYEIEEDIRNQAAKSTGKTAALTTAKKILKAGLKHHNNVLGYAPIINGRQYLCDGFRLVELTEHLPLPNIPQEDISRYPDVNRLIKKYPDMVELELPDKAKLKAFIKISKAKNINNDSQYTGVIYDFGFNYPQVNASYLLDMMELMPCVKAFYKPCSDNSGMILNSIYLENETSRGILLPVRPDKNEPRVKTEV